MKKILLITVLILMLAIATAGGVRSMTQNELSMPLIYAGATLTPTLELTETPTITMTPDPTKTPTPTVTIVPGELWVYIVNSLNDGEQSITYAVVPGIDFELKGQKIEKTLYITAYCPDGLECEVDPVPPDFPPECDFDTGQWCQIEKLIYDGNAQQACGTQFPFNCVETK